MWYDSDKIDSVAMAIAGEDRKIGERKISTEDWIKDYSVEERQLYRLKAYAAVMTWGETYPVMYATGSGRVVD